MPMPSFDFFCNTVTAIVAVCKGLKGCLETWKELEGCSSSASIIGGNEDLVAEILVRLPAKTVVRFKSVSKQWSSLISSDVFTRLHVQNHGRRCVESQDSFIMGDVHGRAELFICRHTVKKLLRVSIPSPIKEGPFKYFEILQSWNGLLLISMKFLGEDRIDYVVFNPTTKHYRLLQLDGYRPLYICLVCDPSKLECYKVLMVTSLTPLIYSVYDPATQEWSHDFEGGDPFTRGDALGFCISSALLRNLIVSSLIQDEDIFSTSELLEFPEEEVYDDYNYMVYSNDYSNIAQLKPFPEENKLSFRIGEWIGGRWEIVETRTVDFNFKNSRIGVELLGMIRQDGAEIKDVVFLLHVPGQLLIYKINQGFKVLVDYRSDYFYVEDEWQFKHVHPFIHTFAPVHPFIHTFAPV